MKTCLICLNACDGDTFTCRHCGEASWSETSEGRGNGPDEENVPPGQPDMEVPVRGKRGRRG